MAKFLRPLRWLSAAAALVLTALLCWQCIDIYLTGNSPDNLMADGVHIMPVYSVEVVSARWNHVALPVWVCLGVMGTALIASWFSQPSQEKLTPDAEHTRMMLVSRIAPEDYPQNAMAERIRRTRTVRTLGYAAMLTLFPAALYMADRDHFTSWDLETVMGSTMLLLIPGAIMFTVMMAISWHIMSNSFRRENELLRPVKKGEQVRFWAQESRIPLTAVRIALLVIAIICIIDGVSNGGMWDVLVKAINICTECIGLG